MTKQNHRNIRDGYEKYLEVADNPVSAKTFTDINKLYNRFLMGKVLDGHVITLPAKMGTLNIQGKYQEIKTEGKGCLAPNWADTKKLWDSNEEAKKKRQIVYCLNQNTDGIRYKFVWSKKNILVENKNLYSLIITREFKRIASKRFSSGFNNFIVK